MAIWFCSDNFKILSISIVNLKHPLVLVLISLFLTNKVSILNPVNSGK